MASGGTMSLITGNNLSEAWAKAFIKCIDAPNGLLAPVSVQFNASDITQENAQIRKIVEDDLETVVGQPGVQATVETVAGTIFPQSIWRMANGDRHKLYHLYKEMLPLMRRKQANRRGTYFQRLIAFETENGKDPINQLEHIINTWRSGNHRHSALQASVFDPRQDHSNSRQWGFPCLQQLVFHPRGTNGKGGLNLVAFYANQTLAEKAYGNYLGLYRLGKFMAQEMGLSLKEVTCIASTLKVSDDLSKKECDKVTMAIRAELNDVQG